jgi:TRAP-type C4-dicarboxylate transport system permease small subunit
LIAGIQSRTQAQADKRLPVQKPAEVNGMGKLFRSLSKAITWFSWTTEVASEIALAGLLLLVFHEVIVRYVFDSPTLYSVEISEYLLVFVAFMSAGWALKENRHVQVRFVVNLLPRKVQWILDVCTSVLAMVFCAILVWKGGRIALTAYTGDYHSSSLLNVPLWIPYAFIPFGALVMGLQYIVRVTERVTALVAKHPEKMEGTAL